MNLSDEYPKNHLMAALPADALSRLEPAFNLVSLKLGDVLYESGEQMDHVFFPTTAIVSLLYIMENGSTAEIGLVGNEGLVGIAIFMGGGTVPNRAVVQSAGKALKLKAEDLQTEFSRSGMFQILLLRFTQGFMTQISQTAVCNRLHSIENHLSRWLLLNHDRLQSDKLVMTQELIANMLGVRREGVTIAARNLQGKKFISYVRGTITILDRKGLEANACECYRVVKNEYDRLLGDYKASIKL